MPELTKTGPTAYCIAGRHDLCTTKATRACPCTCGHDPDAELERLYRAGRTSPELSTMFGIATSSIINRLRRRGVPIRAPGTRIALRGTEITHRYQDGESTHQLAAEYGVSVNTICRVLRDQDVPLRAANRHRVRKPAPPGKPGCTIDYCGDEIIARGMCRYHYDLRRREHRGAP